MLPPAIGVSSIGQGLCLQRKQHGRQLDASTANGAANERRRGINGECKVVDVTLDERTFHEMNGLSDDRTDDLPRNEQLLGRDISEDVAVPPDF